ncbi:hypothetical protein BKA81DRAFT_354256 [Phyllosticta paracitricarpa]
MERARWWWWWRWKSFFLLHSKPHTNNKKPSPSCLSLESWELPVAAPAPNYLYQHHHKTAFFPGVQPSLGFCWSGVDPGK